ncbi:hypothetical protein ACPPVT_18775 [Angustibacter sp. McL0619]|uniref:hypothetical protein n=1 Tax=Angustibacter sp. McL0619 TaxID=3415676 RepID=UPI003CEDF46B
MSEPDLTEQDLSEQDLTEQDGVPSATEPGASVQPHGGQPPEELSYDGSYNDGNLDSRGVEPVDGPEVDPSADLDSLDDDLDTSLRTDGKG